MRPATLLRSALVLALVASAWGWPTAAHAQSSRSAESAANTAAPAFLPTLTFGAVARGGEADSIFYDNGDNAATSFAGIQDPGTPYNTSMQFTATEDITISAASAILRTETSTGNPITFELWDGDGTSGDPTSGTLLTQTSVTPNIPDGGYVRVTFPESFEFEEDDEFYVVIRYPTSIVFPQGFDQIGNTGNRSRFSSTGEPGSWTATGLGTYIIRAIGTTGGGGGGDGPELELDPEEIMATAVTEETTVVALSISNLGDDDLTFSFSDFFGGSDLVESIMPESGTVPGGDAQSVAVVLSAEGLAPGTYTDSITLTTNDEDEGTVTIPVTLEVTDVLAISFDPNPLIEVLETDMTGTETVTVTNNTDDPVTIDFSQYSGDPRPVVTPRQTYPHLELAKGERDPRQGETPLRDSGGPDAFGYQWIDSNEPGGPTFNFVDISGTGNPLNLTDDDGTFVPLPFTFSFYGEDKTQVGISSNGYLTFDESDPTPSTFTNSPLGQPAAPNDVIAPYWDDFDPGDDATTGDGGDVYWQDLEDGRFVVQWNMVPRWADTGGGIPGGNGEPNTFQAILNANGSILFQYEDLNSLNAPDFDSGTVGIENADASIFLEVVFDAPYLEEGLAVLIQARPAFVTDVTPAVGVLPPGASVPITVTFDASGLNGGSYDGTLIVDTDISDGESTFDLPVILVVTGESDCVVNPDPLDFGDLIVGNSFTLEGTVENNGTDTCTLTSASFDDDAFSVDFDGDFDLNPGQEVIYSITFTPDEVGPVTATLTIEVEGGEDITSTVQGTGLAPPNFSVDPDMLTFDVEPGEVSDAQTLTISNDGDGTGNFSVSAVILTNRPGAPAPRDREGPVNRQSEVVTGTAPLPQTNEPTRGGDIVQDGSFEQGTPNPDWEEFSSNFDTPLCDEGSCGLGGGSGPFDGQWWTWFGGISGVDEEGSIEQDVVIPSGTAMLSFWHEIPVAGTSGFMSVTMDGDELFRSTDQDMDKYFPYVQVMIDISEYADGGTHTLRFESETDAGAAGTNFFVDLVEITSEAGLLITVDPDSGTLDTDDSEDISVVADATNAEPGTYQAEVIITTDDPENETITVPVTVNVGGTSTEDEGVPTEFALEQNYPNPFADVTTIKYALPEAAPVTITVYDAVGRRVATLVNEEQSVGRYDVAWSTRGLASGVYFYRIEAGSYSRTMKMSLVR